MKSKPFTFSLEYIKEAISYDPQTGDFTWKQRPRHHFASDQKHAAWNSWRALKKAGTETRHYITISFLGENWKAHRIAFFMSTGIEPTGEIDHVNRNKKDNRISNLREVHRTVNRFNCGPSQRNKSGIVGVYWNKSCQKWAAKIKRSGKAVHLGIFESIEDAAKIRKLAEQTYYSDAI